MQPFFSPAKYGTIQRLTALDHTSADNIDKPGERPWPNRPITGNSYRVYTDRGNAVYVWVAYNGQIEQNRSWCHGFSLGTAARYGYSVFGSSMLTVLNDEWQSIAESAVATGDLAVFYDAQGQVTHSCLIATPVFSGGTLNHQMTLVNTKNGSAPVQWGVPLSTLAAYGSTITYHRKL